MIKILPYERVNNLMMESGSPSDAVSEFGSPVSIRKTRTGNIEYRYKDMYLRFSGGTESFLECTLLPNCIAKIDGIPVVWNKEFVVDLCVLDGDPRIAFGFLILSKYGVAITGIHDDESSQVAITAFSKNELEEFLKDSEKYNFSEFQASNRGQSR